MESRALFARHRGFDLRVLGPPSRVLLSLMQLPGRALKEIPSSCGEKLALSEPKIELDLPEVSEIEGADASRWCDPVSDLWREGIYDARLRDWERGMDATNTPDTCEDESVGPEWER
ncbi:unnamed protein product [Peniophora sp. CBMAI 1063]|nr:unnamed protein product [Peniophora sp. CBMAI 1063]